METPVFKCVDSLCSGSDYGTWLSKKYQNPSKFPMLPISKSIFNVFVVYALRNVKCIFSWIFECLHIIIWNSDSAIFKKNYRAHTISSVLSSYSDHHISINPSSLGFSITVQSLEWFCSASLACNKLKKQICHNRSLSYFEKKKTHIKSVLSQSMAG